MSPRHAALLAWGLLSLAILVMLTGLCIAYLNRSTPIPWGADLGSRGLDVALFPLFLVFPAVGALIASRRPANPIGWLFCLGGLGLLTNIAAKEYYIYALLTEPAAGGEDWANWYTAVVLSPTFSLPTAFLLLLFPNGRIPSPRWRPVAWFTILVTLVSVIGVAFTPDLCFQGDEFGCPPNPIGAGGSAGQFFSDLGGVGWLFSPLVFLLAAAALFVRFRRSSGRERLQIKWLASAGALLAISAIASFLAYELSEVLLAASATFTAAGFVAVPVATAISILRHNLYEIDRIINRTLTYGLLTASLAAVYFGLVVGLQALLRPVNGGSDFAIVATTLIVAAMFLPARRRIQGVVDRRFNRRAYDAARTMDAFSARLREQIDLDTLRYELLAVVDETMQPEKASLWLREVPAR